MTEKINEANDIFLEIGRIVVRFQQIEIWLSEVLAGLLLMRD